MLETKVKRQRPFADSSQITDSRRTRPEIKRISFYLSLGVEWDGIRASFVVPNNEGHFSAQKVLFPFVRNGICKWGVLGDHPRQVDGLQLLIRQGWQLKRGMVKRLFAATRLFSFFYVLFWTKSYAVFCFVYFLFFFSWT